MDLAERASKEQELAALAEIASKEQELAALDTQLQQHFDAAMRKLDPAVRNLSDSGLKSEVVTLLSRCRDRRENCVAGTKLFVECERLTSTLHKVSACAALLVQVRSKLWQDKDPFGVAQCMVRASSALAELPSPDSELGRFSLFPCSSRAHWSPLVPREMAMATMKCFLPTFCLVSVASLSISLHFTSLHFSPPICPPIPGL